MKAKNREPRDTRREEEVETTQILPETAKMYADIPLDASLAS